MTSLEALVDRVGAWVPPPADLEPARLRVADVACALRLGSSLPGWAPAGRAFGRGLGQGAGGYAGERPGGTALGSGQVAAMAACCRFTEIDDIELATCTTPGSVVVPAALAAWTLRGGRGDGRDLLAAVAAGYEVMVGAAALLGGAYAQGAGIWATRAVAALTAAATAARALALPPDAVGEAVALAAGSTFSGTFPEPARAWSLGMAVACGFGAAVAAAEGLRGQPGQLARWPGSAGGPVAPESVARAVAALGGASAVGRSRCKPYAGARQVLAGSATLRLLVERGAVEPGEVVAVHLAVPPVHAAMVDRRQLHVRLDTLASAQYQLATALEAPERLDELDHPLPAPPSLASRMATVEVSGDESLGAPAGPCQGDAEAGFPARWQARIELVHRDGNRTVHRAPGVPGEEPFGWPQVEGKARRLALANGVDPAELDRLVAMVREDDWTGLAGALAAAAVPNDAGGGR